MLLQYIIQPEPVYPDIELIGHLTEICEQMLSLDPNGKITIAGDIIQLPELMGHLFSFSRLILRSDH